MKKMKREQAVVARPPTPPPHVVEPPAPAHAPPPPPEPSQPSPPEPSGHEQRITIEDDEEFSTTFRRKDRDPVASISPRPVKMFDENSTFSNAHLLDHSIVVPHVNWTLSPQYSVASEVLRDETVLMNLDQFRREIDFAKEEFHVMPASQNSKGLSFIY